MRRVLDLASEGGEEASPTAEMVDVCHRGSVVGLDEGYPAVEGLESRLHRM